MASQLAQTNPPIDLQQKHILKLERERHTQLEVCITLNTYLIYDKRVGERETHAVRSQYNSKESGFYCPTPAYGR
jgi:hypothetical protein